MSRSRSLFVTFALVTSSFALLLVIRAVAVGDEPAKAVHVYGTAPRDDAGAAVAFESMIPVLHHPRCMNCHFGEDFPRQGDDSHQHTFDVRRGPDDRGVDPLKCSACHQDHNSPEAGAPPGAPDWRLAPVKMKWKGLSDRQLCELFKDPARNDGRNVDEMIEHMNTPLVLWGWHPGPGRTPVPISQPGFMRRVNEWAAKGAACPASK